MMDQGLIIAFRDKVYSDFQLYETYRNCGGRNKWSVVRSAIEWIEIGVSGIDVDKLEWSNTKPAIIKFITFIMCIDIMWEGIAQLHRVFYNTKEMPFKTDHNIFNKTISDNDYWKEIRAAFAAHPTNLDGTMNGERRFASWSNGLSIPGEYSLALFSNQASTMCFDYFDIRIDEIMRFAESRYGYLNELMGRWAKETFDLERPDTFFEEV